MSHTHDIVHTVLSVLLNGTTKAKQSKYKGKKNVPLADPEPPTALSYSPTLIFRIYITFPVYSPYNVRPLPCKLADTVMEPVKVASG